MMGHRMTGCGPAGPATIEGSECLHNERFEKAAGANEPLTIGGAKAEYPRRQPPSDGAALP